MTDRQRAFVSALVYLVKNNLFAGSHGIGVKPMSSGATPYEFRGEWKKDSILVRDDKHNRAEATSFSSNQWGAKISWQGRISSADIDIKIPEGSSQFSGHYNADYSNFEGTYYAPSDTVEIRDHSQDKDKYYYRIIW